MAELHGPDCGVAVRGDRERDEKAVLRCKLRYLACHQVVIQGRKDRRVLSDRDKAAHAVVSGDAAYAMGRDEYPLLR